jgi:hypothetical protein
VIGALDRRLQEYDEERHFMQGVATVRLHETLQLVNNEVISKTKKGKEEKGKKRKRKEKYIFLAKLFLHSLVRLNTRRTDTEQLEFNNIIISCSNRRAFHR